MAPAISTGNGITSVITSGNRVAIPVIATTVGGQTHHMTGSTQEQVPSTAELYLCTTNNATGMYCNSSNYSARKIIQVGLAFKLLAYRSGA